MKKTKYRLLSALFVMVIAAGCFSSSRVYAGESTQTIISADEVGTGSAVEHTHIYQTYYDEHYHWEQCIVCKAIRNKEAHNLKGNGGSKVLFSDYYSNAYRDTCDCGYKSPCQIVILGTHENYPKGDNAQLTYSSLNGTRLKDYKQITKAEYTSLYSSYQALPGATYEWHDFDGDGYGYVFASSLIVGNKSYGTKGTIELIVGDEGDCGRMAAYDEYYTLVEYCRSDSTPTRAEFVNHIKAKINSSKNPTYHALYGYDTKYSTKVTDFQFDKLVSIAKYINYHAPSWGCGSTVLTYDSVFTMPGYHYYGSYQVGCYDSNIMADVGWSTGYAGTCDVCGKTYTGNESYTNTSWINDSAGNNPSVRNIVGGTYECSGHTVTGSGNEVLGKTYCHYKNADGKVFVKFTLEPAEGFTATQTNPDWIEIPKADTTGYVHYTNGASTATFYRDETAVRSMYLGFYHILNDNTEPSAYGYSNSTTSNDYWKVTGCGTPGNISTNARLTVTFSDPDQFSYNTLSVQLFDSDSKTLIIQANGASATPLVRIGGTAGTSGEPGYWRGTVDVCAEVNGSKLIYVQATDSTGNKSAKIPVQIQYLDAKGPDLKVVSSDNLNTWSKTKTFTVTATDSSGTVYVGTDREDLRLVSNSAYGNSRTYVINGDLAGEKSITFYAKDPVGNVSYKTVNFSKLDNSYPEISVCKVNDFFENGEAVAWKLIAAGSDSGSGIAGIAVTKDTKEPATNAYMKATEFKISRSGTYYVWVRDNVGNVTRSPQIVIKSDLQLNGLEINSVRYNGTELNYIIYNGRRLRL